MQSKTDKRIYYIRRILQIAAPSKHIVILYIQWNNPLYQTCTSQSNEEGNFFLCSYSEHRSCLQTVSSIIWLSGRVVLRERKKQLQADQQQYVILSGTGFTSIFIQNFFSGMQPGAYSIFI